MDLGIEVDAWARDGLTATTHWLGFLIFMSLCAKIHQAEYE